MTGDGIVVPGAYYLPFNKGFRSVSGSFELLSVDMVILNGPMGCGYGSV